MMTRFSIDVECPVCIAFEDVDASERLRSEVSTSKNVLRGPWLADIITK